MQELIQELKNKIETSIKDEKITQIQERTTITTYIYIKKQNREVTDNLYQNQLKKRESEIVKNKEGRKSQDNIK